MRPEEGRARGHDRPDTCAPASVALVVLLVALSACAQTRNGAVAEGREDGLEAVAPGIHLLRGEFSEGRQPDGNSVVLDGKAGLIVVDTGRHVHHTRRLLSFARRVGRPIEAVINTHWHLDHSGGNVLLRQELPGIEVFGSTAVDDALSGFLLNYRSQIVEYLPKIEDGEERARMEAELALIDAGGALAPTRIVSSSGPREIAGRRLELHLESDSVTGGDVWIFDRETGVLIAGDLVTLPVPLLDTACSSRWLAALDRMADVEFTLLVPGHGPPLDRAGFERFRVAFHHLMECGSTDRTDENCASGWIEDIGSLVPEVDHPFTRRLLDYYVPNHVRRQAPGLCGG